MEAQPGVRGLGGSLGVDLKGNPDSRIPAGVWLMFGVEVGTADGGQRRLSTTAVESNALCGGPEDFVQMISTASSAV